MFFEYYARNLERICKEYQARPHWGKVHFMSNHELAQVFPKWSDFLKYRNQMDPKGMFLNPFLESLFTPVSTGPKGSEKKTTSMNFFFNGMINSQ